MGMVSEDRNSHGATLTAWSLGTTQNAELTQPLIDLY